MDEEVKGLMTAAIVVALVVFVLTGVANWRWRLNRRDMIQRDVEYIKAGYVQKAIPTEFETVWIRDSNSQ